MLRLETVEDFERVRKALDNPRSSSDEYRVKDFGFCCFCDRITEYRIEPENEWGIIFCFQCKMTFKPGHHMDYSKNNPEGPYITHIPRESDTGERLHYLRSRVQQTTYFLEMLEQFIGRQKTEERKIRNTIRRLAKLRLTKKSSSTRWALDHLS